MINFRYHLVSLTAVFLALTLGVVMGAAVVDQALVRTLEDQLDSVGTRADAVATNNDRLAEQLAQWQTFADQAADELISARLAGVPVAIVSVAGVDRDVVARLESTLRNAGATIPAEIVLTARFELDDPQSVEELAAITATGGPSTPEAVRSDAINQLAASWAGAGPPAILGDLEAAAFAEVRTETPDAPPPLLADVAPRYLFVSSADADVPNQDLAVPMAASMGRAGLPLVAADVTRDDSEPDDPMDLEVAPFADALRDDGQSRGRITTVDHAAGFRGRTAVVLGLVALGEGRSGHYGTAPGAERLLPD